MKRLFTGLRSWFYRMLYLLVPRMKQRVQDMLKPATKSDEPKNKGEKLWDGRLGTYTREATRIGRNDPCPCGAMRVAPRDVTKQIKWKWCCGA